MPLPLLARIAMRAGRALPLIALALVLAGGSCPALADPPPEDQRHEPNGPENLTAGRAAVVGQVSARPVNFEYLVDFFGQMAQGANPILAAFLTSGAMLADEGRKRDEEVGRLERLRAAGRSALPSAEAATTPADAPPESILDDVEDGSLGVMFGFGAPPAPIPPPESILEDIEEPTFSMIFGGSAGADAGAGTSGQAQETAPAPTPTAAQQAQIDDALKKAARNPGLQQALQEFGAPEVRDALSRQTAAPNQARAPDIVH